MVLNCMCILEADALPLGKSQILAGLKGEFLCFYDRSLRVLLSIGGMHCLLNNGMGWRITSLKSLSRYKIHSMLLCCKSFDILSLSSYVFFSLFPSLHLLNFLICLFTFDHTCIAFKQRNLISSGEAVCQQAQYYLGSGKPASFHRINFFYK